MKKILFLILFLSLLPLSTKVKAQQPVDSTRIYFKLGQRQYYPEYRDNGASMMRLIEAIRKSDADSTLRKVEIRAYASPDGSETANNRLSRLRSGVLTDYILQNTGVDPSIIDTRSEGIAWDELREMVAADSRVPARDEVLDILRNHPEYSSNMRKIALMGLRGGAPYRWMFKNLFPELRSAVGLYIYARDTHDDVSPAHKDNSEATAETAASAVPDTQDHELDATGVSDTLLAEGNGTAEQDSAATPEETSAKNTDIPVHLFALKTNLLYDAALMPSLEFEWRINSRWSVAAEGSVAWWSKDRTHKYYQIMYLGAEGRYWFGRRLRPWHGMYAGLMAGGGKYDLENGKKGYKGEAAVAGLTFGYMFPVTRTLSFDAEIGLGYMFTRFKEYVPFDGHYIYQRTKDMNYFGPVKAKFSFVWRFGNAGNTKKGGEI